MEDFSPSDETVLVSWINTFPDLPRSVESFDDLFDGLIFCSIISQIDYRASFIPVQDLYNITNEESIELFNGINEYLKSGLVDADPEASEEQVLNIEAIVYDHDREEVFYLTKVILGLAIQCPQKNIFLTRITELPHEIQQVLTPIAEEVLSTMQYQEDFNDEYIADDQLMTFEEMMEGDELAYREEDVEELDNWNNSEAPEGMTTPTEDISKYLEEKDNEIFSLKDEILRLKEEISDLEGEIKAISSERELLLMQQDQLNSKVSDYTRIVSQLEMKLEEASQNQIMESTITETESLQVELEKVETENAEFKKRVGELTKDLETQKQMFEEQLHSVKEELVKETNRSQKFKKQVESMEEQLQKVIKASENSASSPSPEAIRVQQLMDENAKLKGMIKSNQTEMNTIEAEKQKLIQQIKTLEMDNKQYMSDMDQLTQKLESMQSIVHSNEPSPQESFGLKQTVVMEQSSGPCMECEKLREKMELSKKEYHRVLKDMENQIKKYERDIEDKKSRMSKQYDYSKKTEEVMFTVISKLGETALMDNYKSYMQSYRPKGWLGQMRVSLSKI